MAKSLPLKRDGEAQDCFVVELEGQISMWDGKEAVCLGLVGQEVKVGGLVAV